MILHGRNLLLKGLVWRIVNGESVNVWHDDWIPRSGVRHPLGKRSDKSVEKVSDLLLPGTKEWNVELTNEVFYEADVNDILQIQIGTWEGDDYLAWNYTSNGTFSVKYAYKARRFSDLVVHLDRKGGSSSSSDAHKGWLKLWSCDVPGKMKIHTWRVARRSVRSEPSWLEERLSSMLDAPTAVEKNLSYIAFGVAVM